MAHKEAYLDQVTTEVEDLVSQIALLKVRFARQKVAVKVAHFWELEYVRTRFAEFKRRVEQLEDAEDLELGKLQEDVHAAWKDVMQAVDTLMTALNGLLPH